MKQINIFVDGGARGNPGEAAIGVYVLDDQKIVLAKIGKRIGSATNNEAEYKALLEGVGWILQNQKKIDRDAKINIYVDSILVYSQVSGLFKVKNDKIRQLIFSLREKEAQITSPIFYGHIPREKNREADKLVNLALDNLL
jgi:ribonuclease HI